MDTAKHFCPQRSEKAGAEPSSHLLSWFGFDRVYELHSGNPVPQGAELRLPTC